MEPLRGLSRGSSCTERSSSFASTTSFEPATPDFPSPIDPEEMTSNLERGNYYRAQQKWDKAVETYTLALKEAEEQKEGVDLAILYNCLGDNLVSIDEVDQAIPCFQEALCIYRNAYGDKHPKVLKLQELLGL
ncbi:MAG: tetratricopeptide repeat protein [Parachlamydia sp.]|nr:tetratricopeptide repeat protein [Parachlamydia sp.]